MLFEIKSETNAHPTKRTDDVDEVSEEEDDDDDSERVVESLSGVGSDIARTPISVCFIVVGCIERVEECVE
jgi:hypothetical protein